MKKIGSVYLALKIFGISSFLLFIGIILIQYTQIQDDLKDKFRNVSFVVFSFFALYASHIFHQLRQSINAMDKECFYFIFLGLFSFFIAETIWAIYVILNIDPSLNLTLADVFWLVGSLLLVYGLFKMVNIYAIKISNGMNITITASVFIIAILLVFYFGNINDMQALVNALYPILDLILALQSSLIFYSFKKANVLTSHYLILAAGFFIMFTADFIYYIISIQLGESLITHNIAVFVDFIYALSYIIIGISFLTGIESHELIASFTKQ